MINDTENAKNSINHENLKLLTERQSLLEEQRICEIYEIAREAYDSVSDMLSEGYSVYEVLSVISDSYLVLPEYIHKKVSELNMNRLVNFVKSLSAYDKVIFSELLRELISNDNEPIGECDFLISRNAEETFTYVKNPLADEAYDVFSESYVNPKVKYSSSISEAAAAVAKDSVSYALLPLEEKGGARLATVASLIFAYDLKINSVTPVFGFDGVADMKYALVSKHFTIPTLEEEDDRYLEIRIKKEEASLSLSELLDAAFAMGISVYRVNSISFATEDGDVTYYSLVFKREGKDFSPLLTYLTLFSGDYTPIGIYKNLE